jgi:hypothetical protein
LPTAPPLQLPLALCAIFVLECLIALHTLWPNYPAYVSLLGLWIGVAPWIRWGTLKPRGVVFGLLLILPFAFISNHTVLGHRPYYEVAAESKARLQLGPDYADYRYFARNIDLVFRPGDSVLIRASLIACNPDLSDLQDVAVTWKEPWAGGR